MALEPNEQRVIKEREELFEKHEKLIDFISSNVFEELDFEDQRNLVLQEHFMNAYHQILQDRIKRFTYPTP